MSGKVLIVDDETHIRLLLEQTLEELEDDYEVEIHSTSDGRQEGLDQIRNLQPSLVFLDIMMPKMKAMRSAARSSPTLPTPAPPTPAPRSSC